MKFSISSLSSPSIQRRENPEKRLNQLRSSTMADNNKFTQFFIKLFDNKTLTLQFPSHQTLTVQSIKHQIETLTLIPSQFQNLTLNGKFLHNSTSISPQSLSLTTLHLNFSLLGGKGGFGSLLRGAATKAGQKKTNNFDACRDMSGRRLRHVNAEKKLEEWKAEEEERRLEKVAEEYLKKMMNKGKGGKKEEGAEKYVAKYREDSAKCVKDVEKSVRESVKDLFDGGKKRKFMEKLKGKGEVEGVDAKKLKIWMGKRKFGESDSDDSDVDDEKSDESDVENEKSSVINNENQSDTSKDGSFGSASVPESDVDYLGGRSSDSGSEEEKETVTGGSSGSGGTPSGGPMNGDGGLMDTSSDSSDAEGKADQTKELSVSAEVVTTFTEAVIEQAPGEPHPLGTVVTDQLPSASSLTEQEVSQLATIPECPGASASESKSDSHDEGVAGSLNVSDALQPLNFDDYNSAAELEALGLERLKSELQARGLKCGGTLQERAARLFLLKTTPLEKLPKKLLAKK